MAFVFSLQSILKILPSNIELEGDFSGSICGIASLSLAEEGDLSFLGNPKYRKQVAVCRASVLLLPKDYSGKPSEGQLYLRVENPSFSLAMICREIERTLMPAPVVGVHPSAVIHESAEISPKASVGPLCVVGAGSVIGAAILESQVTIGRNVKIGDNARIYPHVFVGDYSEVGERNRLHPGCVLGSDGYGYEYVDNSHQRVPQVGNVVTAADVDVGANTTIDRARFGSTYIGEGTKIDNQVQIAHNVRIGRQCLLVAQVGISGSTEIGDGVVIGGQAGVAGHLKIGNGVMIAGKAGVTKSISGGIKVRGNPAVEMSLHNRVIALQRKLPELFKRFDQLEKSIEPKAFGN